MVSKVFPQRRVDRISTVEFARRIAKLPTMAALLIKESVNQTVDAMGFTTALDAASRSISSTTPTGVKSPAGTVIRNGRVRTRRLARRAGDPARDQAAPVRPDADRMDVNYPPEAEAFRVPDSRVPGRASAGRLVGSRRTPPRRSGKRSRSGGGAPSRPAAWSPCPGRRSTAARDFPRSNRWCSPRSSPVPGAPERTENDLLGIELLGNTLIALGSEAAEEAFPAPHLVRRRSLVPRILRTRGRLGSGGRAHQGALDGDEWVINGQKIWTSAGPTANWIFVLARTNPGRAQAQGLVLPAGADGPTRCRRPADRQRGRTSSFSEVFFTDARTRTANVVGGLGDGWSTAMTLLGFERGSQVTTAAIDFGRDLDRLCELARQRGLQHRPAHPTMRWRGAYSRVQIMRYRGYRALTSSR